MLSESPDAAFNIWPLPLQCPMIPAMREAGQAPCPHPAHHGATLGCPRVPQRPRLPPRKFSFRIASWGHHLAALCCSPCSSNPVTLPGSGATPHRPAHLHPHVCPLRTSVSLSPRLCCPNQPRPPACGWGSLEALCLVLADLRLGAFESLLFPHKHCGQRDPNIAL